MIKQLHSEDEALSTRTTIPESYEEALTELEGLIHSMESGKMVLDELYENYRRGNMLLQFCREKLEAVENQVRILEHGQLTSWKDDYSI